MTRQKPERSAEMTSFQKNWFFPRANLRFPRERASPERAGVGAVTSLREMTLSNAKASVTRLSNTFHIFHRVHPSRRARSRSRHCTLFLSFPPFPPLSLSLLLSPLLSLSRETKIEANIVAVVLPRMRSRVHIHDIYTYTRSDRITQTHTSMAHRPGETADKYRAVSRRYLRDTFAGCARRNA